MAKDIFSKIIRDYNNELEKILEKKAFSEDVKNLLLSMFYKIENAYNDYRKTKVNVQRKDKFLDNILEIIEDCSQIEIIKPTTEEGKKLYEENKNCIVDKENKTIKTFQNEKSMLEAIILLKQEKIELDPIYKLIEQPIIESLLIGNQMNQIEVITDFNGWSWDITKLDTKKYEYKKIYNIVLELADNKIVGQLTKNTIDDEIEEMPSNVIISSKYNENFGITKEDLKEIKKDHIKELKNNLEKNYGKSKATELIEKLIKLLIFTCASYNKEYKEKIKQEIINLETELEKMNDNKVFLEDLSNKKKEANDKIKKIDKILSDSEKLKKDYEKRNAKLANKDKIFSVSHLRIMYEKERERLIEEIKQINKKMEPMEFVNIKTNIEKRLEFFKDIRINDKTRKNLLRLETKLDNIYIRCLKIKANKGKTNKEIERLIFKIRYYKLTSLVYPDKNTNSEDEDIKSINETANENMELIKNIEQKLVLEAIDAKLLTKFCNNNLINYEILNIIFNTKIIDLDTITYVLKFSKGIITINIYDLNTHDGTKDIKITQKTELSVKLNKKIKVWQ